VLQGEWDQTAHQAKKIAKVIAEANAFYGVAADTLTFLVSQPNRTADPSVVRVIFRKRRGNDTLTDFGLDQHVRVAIWRIDAWNPSDVKGGVGPIRLRQIFDYTRNATVSLDQQNIPRFE
jgi:hypothetical protein